MESINGKLTGLLMYLFDKIDGCYPLKKTAPEIRGSFKVNLLIILMD